MTQRQQDRSRMTVFRARDAQPFDRSGETGMMRFGEVSARAQEDLRRLYEAGASEGGQGEILLRHDGDDGYSLAFFWFKPNYPVARHSHDADCLYYVVSGEAILGSQVLGTGDGFYVPADHPYSYRAGPEGVEVLEFRHATTITTHLVEENPEVVDRAIELARENRARWLEERVPPSRRAQSSVPSST